MKRLAIFRIGLVLLAIGIASGYYVGVATKTIKDFAWKELSIDPSGKGYGFTSEALFNSDIGMPDIKQFLGKSKFLSSTNDRKDELYLGYVVLVNVEKLDLAKVPEKYKVEGKEKYRAGEFTVLPIEEVVYQVVFYIERN